MVAFGLENLITFDLAKLAERTVHRANQIGRRQRTCAGFEGPREKIVEGRVAGDVWIGRFGHVHPVFADKPADDAGCGGTAAHAGNVAAKLCQCLFGQEILQKYIKSFGHAGSLCGLEGVYSIGALVARHGLTIVSLRLQAQKAALRAVGQDIQQAVRPLAHIPDPAAAFQQLVLAQHLASEGLRQLNAVQVAKL